MDQLKERLAEFLVSNQFLGDRCGCCGSHTCIECGGSPGYAHHEDGCTIGKLVAEAEAYLAEIRA